MASWLIGTPGEVNHSCFRSKYMQERVEAKPMLTTGATATLPSTTTSATTTSATTNKATKTKLNRSAIKSCISTI